MSEQWLCEFRHGGTLAQPIFPSCQKQAAVKAKLAAETLCSPYSTQLVLSVLVVYVGSFLGPS